MIVGILRLTGLIVAVSFVILFRKLFGLKKKKKLRLTG